ncbi:hypothetical protein ACFWU5_16655 [Nocardia sp. NPDC058640]|uniref:hypothetical protein n=1 Tax=Nocardia sp. NPDC058640 TaxID=3346571 RepID=UPI0036549BFC
MTTEQAALTKCERLFLAAVTLWDKPVTGCTTEDLANTLQHNIFHTGQYLERLHAKGMLRRRQTQRHDRWWPTKAGIDTLEPVIDTLEPVE